MSRPLSPRRPRGVSPAPKRRGVARPAARPGAHLSPSSPDFWGRLCDDGAFRLVVVARSGYGLQSAAPEGWRMVETFPHASALRCHTEGGAVYRVGPVLTEFIRSLPDDPSSLLGAVGLADRASLQRLGLKLALQFPRQTDAA